MALLPARSLPLAALLLAACTPAKPAEAPPENAPVAVPVERMAQDDAPLGPEVSNPGDQFELTIGGKVYSAAADKPFEVEIGGRRVEAVIRAKEVLHFVGSGLSFRYPKEMTFSEEKMEGVSSYTVEGADSTLVIIQLYTVEVEPDTVSSLLVSGIEKEMRSRGGSFLPTSGGIVTRRFRGKDVEGKRLEFALAKEAMQTQIFVMKKGKNTIAVLMQRSDKDAILAERRFKVIGESLW